MSQRVCFISLGSYPLFNPDCRASFGGSEVQMYLWATHLAKDPDFSVHMIVGNFGQGEVEERDHVVLYRGPRPAPGKKGLSKIFHLLRNAWTLFRLMKKAEADVYVQRTSSLGTGFVCFFAHLLGKKFIYMVAHDIDCNGGFETWYPWLHGKIYQYGIRHADVVVSQSDAQRQLLQEHHKKESVVIRTLYDIGERPSIPRSERQSVLWVGRCERWKRPEIFLEMAHRLPDVSFVYIMPPASADLLFYQDIVKQLESYPNIRHIPYVPFHEMDIHFREAKILIQTSDHEGYPNTFIQAMKNETPILSLSVDPDQLLERHGTGVHVYGDRDRLEKELRALLNDADLQADIGKRGYDFVSEFHNAEKIIAAYKYLFLDPR